jgi:hypothetical protein
MSERRTSRVSIAFAALGAAAVALPLPGYYCLLNSALEYGSISAAEYQIGKALLEFLLLPGRTLLSATPFEGALGWTDEPFWRGLVIHTLGAVLGWFLLILALWWALRRGLDLLSRTGSGIPSSEVTDLGVAGKGESKGLDVSRKYPDGQ